MVQVFKRARSNKIGPFFLGAGNWHVTSTHNMSSPWGTHSEIVVMPETDFAPTGTNVVDLVAN
jgi:hypothetical protein